jgi:hypothetical protein
MKVACRNKVALSLFSSPPPPATRPPTSSYTFLSSEIFLYLPIFLYYVEAHRRQAQAAEKANKKDTLGIDED